MRAIVAPDDILYGRRSELRKDLLLLDIVENNTGRGAEEQAGGAAVEDVVGGGRASDGLGDVVVEVTNVNGLGVLVEHGEAVASDKEGSLASASLAAAFRRFCSVFGKGDELVNAVVCRRGDDDGALGRVVRDGAGLDELGAKATDREDGGVCASGEIVSTNRLVSDVEEHVLVDAEGRSFSVELEDDETRVVTFVKIVLG